VPVAGSVENFGDYHLVILAFPIWYGCAPNVVNTFCKEYDWTGKKVAAVATSGGSGIGKTADKLKQRNYCDLRQSVAMSFSFEAYGKGG